MKTKRAITLLFACTAIFVEAQYLTKGLILLDISGEHTTFEETVDQGIPTYSRSFLLVPKVGVGLRIGKDIYGYLSLGYGFGTDTTRQGYIINNDENPVQEKVKKSIPIIGVGFKKFYQLGETPFFFSTDVSVNIGMGKLDGTLHYSYVRWGDLIEIDLVSEGQQSSIDAGITPGLAFFSKSGWFVDLGIGFVGYSYLSKNIEYSDGFDDTSSLSSFRLDLSAASIKFRVGTMF